MCADSFTRCDKASQRWLKGLSLYYALASYLIPPIFADTPPKEGSFEVITRIGNNTTSNDVAAKILFHPPDTLYIGGVSEPGTVERNSESDLGTGFVSGLRMEDYFFSKVNVTTGKVIWAYRDGSSKNDRMHSMYLESSGRYLYVAGRTFGRMSGVINKGQSDMFIVKYDVSAPEPVSVWSKPFVLGTGASDAITYITGDPNNEKLLYATGLTSGNLFPDNNFGFANSSDAVAFSVDTNTGILINGAQFGGRVPDYGTGIVLESSSDVMFVSTVTERKIGQFSFGNFHMYKINGKFEMLGDLLIRTFSREQVESFAMHNSLKDTLLVSGSSRLDSRQGFDIFLKRVITPFDGSNMSSIQVDFDEVSPREYTKRYGSDDKKHDYATDMVVLKGGGVIVSGYTDGSFGVKNNGSNVGVFALLDARNGSMLETRQIVLPNSRRDTWMDIISIALSSDEQKVYYTGRESNVTTKQFHVHIGQFVIPKSWKATLGIEASATPTASPTPVDVIKRANAEVNIGLWAGVGGGVLGLGMLIALVIWVRIRQQRRAVGLYDEREQEKGKMGGKRAGGAKAESAANREGGLVQGGNAGGLV